MAAQEPGTAAGYQGLLARVTMLITGSAGLPMDCDHLINILGGDGYGLKSSNFLSSETMINAMGMTLDGGAGTGLLKTGMQDYSAQGWVDLAKSVGQAPVPWSEEDADVLDLIQKI